MVLTWTTGRGEDHSGNVLVLYPPSLFELLKFILVIVSSFSGSSKEQQQSATGWSISQGERNQWWVHICHWWLLLCWNQPLPLHCASCRTWGQLCGKVLGTHSTRERFWGGAFLLEKYRHAGLPWRLSGLGWFSHKQVARLQVMDSLEIGVLHQAGQLEVEISGAIRLDENIYMGKGCVSILKGAVDKRIVTVKVRKPWTPKIYQECLLWPITSEIFNHRDHRKQMSFYQSWNYRLFKH